MGLIMFLKNYTHTKIQTNKKTKMLTVNDLWVMRLYAAFIFFMFGLLVIIGYFPNFMLLMYYFYNPK